jgi:hypothetical protein
MYELACIHKYDSELFWDGRNTELNNHWLVLCSMNYENYDELYEYSTLYVNLWDSINNKLLNSIQIVDLYEKEDTCLCIIKTVWLKIFQRKFKNYYNKKMSYYKNPRNIRKREITGKWF